MLKLKTLTPSVANNLRLVATHSFFMIEKPQAKFLFPHLEHSAHSDDEEETILRSPIGNFVFYDRLPDKTLIPEPEKMNFSIPLLSLLQPVTKTFEINPLNLNAFSLKTIGNTGLMTDTTVLIAQNPGVEYTFEATNFDPQICQKINQISLIQLQQIEQLSVLLGFENNDRLRATVNFLREQIPDNNHGCLVHWTFGPLEQLLAPVTPFEPVLYFAQRMTRDLGWELLPLNWAVVEKEF